ncbi:MAG TPA: GNAT family N-acetyltransferase [Candidatus Eisenbacteria bacterium]|nr:GNAT family N-acetyltransferase [Candidatus Eisenbacteria bacterium]
MQSPAASSFVIEAMRPEDWAAVRAIYLEGIATGNATFETEPPAWDAWDAAHAKEPRLVARETGEPGVSGGAPDPLRPILGWAALTPVSGRCVYAGVGDLSVYVAGSARGRGVGKALLRALVTESERAGIWTLQAGIFPENETSLALHRSCGFREVGRRERIGKMNGVWRDVMLLERRSEVAGV